ncbi:MAG: bifunctional UDP-N-acetylglucosamine diphosphorylase/glucosamine-1-phosphate N-acetyltransferase GlmU [Aestuariivirga sp.]|uniref:bifunctional UDP-N-acetylglucosamine diphosphorylase/glucosamine-1-phosphate N-acetyltransferase GlmU n=1 Tax=Aestuariivirga sp. TaxID=2650926 RepID=UPI0025C6B6A6|nr:bifunctional UDP-N-acetylglucosamine diphosphorylase/glucosamine-1-phosphate N-acetyltransferase GlmU [Aestuariivirga sp.]MCA3562591.1 bifunctional UDP-N-acetylglucosamine diphosphorylase/glucosamine-1-phosphate N-acetyltransferase GlmU [Aestuariivirga sp.]
MTDIAIIVLAAGKGTRMKSDLPKVLHRAAGRSLLGHVLHAARELEPREAVVVVGPDMEAVSREAQWVFPDARKAVQVERLGTGHAVSMARDALQDFSGTVLILYGDVPLVATESLRKLAGLVGAGMALLGFEAANPHGYGRLVQDASGHVVKIREELDASPAERAIRLCNSGIMAIDSALLWSLLPKLGNANAKGEYYLTDLVELAAAAGAACRLATCAEQEVAGVNDRIQLAAIESALQQTYRRRHMLNGATLVAPETVFFSADTVIGQDVVIEPNVVFGPGVEIGGGVEILAFSHIEGARVAVGARIGPYARLRPGADIGEEVHIGNFVEVKKAAIGKGAKANHLTYIGDARVGARTNVGAGTITCNYDGFEKHLTDIGENVFVGSNTAFVAPVSVGDGASIAAGSVITRNVPPDALAMTRAELELREGWAKRYRDMKAARKAERNK